MAKIGQMVKQGMVEELAQKLKERPNAFVTKINRLTAGDAGDLRKKLHETQACMIVVKRRLGLRTLEQLKLTELKNLLEGSVGLVLSENDPTPIAKQLFEFMKEHEDHLSVRGGLLEGQLLDEKRIAAIAKLPGKPQLLAEVVGTLEAPLQDVLTTIEQLIGDLAYAVEELSRQRPAQEEKREAKKAATAEEKAEAASEAKAEEPKQQTETKSEQEPPTKKEGDV